MYEIAVIVDDHVGQAVAAEAVARERLRQMGTVDHVEHATGPRLCFRPLGGRFGSWATVVEPYDRSRSHSLSSLFSYVQPTRNAIWRLN